MRLIVLSTIVAICALSSCAPEIESPLKKGEVKLCGSDRQIIEAVQEEASRLSLSFHYGTHSVHYGTQLTFRLIGNGFEIVMFNAGSQDAYFLSTYVRASDSNVNARALAAYAGLEQAMTSDPSLLCKDLH